ncbi:MAG: hypothetical protein GY801_17945 [bacterium]|nr:hypothetical protein [bacterium]
MAASGGLPPTGAWDEWLRGLPPLEIRHMHTLFMPIPKQYVPFIRKLQPFVENLQLERLRLLLLKHLT